MRIPFIRKAADAATRIPLEQISFIKNTKGGSQFLLAGGLFWLAGAVIAHYAPHIFINYVIYGGLAVPFVGLMVAHLQSARLFEKSSFTPLAAMAPIIEMAAIPIMLYLKPHDPLVLPAILMLMDGAHLFIYMWIHLDYTYFIAGYLLAFFAVLCMFGVLPHHSFVLQMSFAGIVSIVSGLLIWRDSSRTVELYTKTIT